jgi:hypothetical protein
MDIFSVIILAVEWLLLVGLLLTMDKITWVRGK